MFLSSLMTWRVLVNFMSNIVTTNSVTQRRHSQCYWIKRLFSSFLPPERNKGLGYKEISSPSTSLNTAQAVQPDVFQGPQPYNSLRTQNIAHANL